jgi:hypothetical protein
VKLLKVGLRLWIGAASVVSFLAGWIILAHSPKPVVASSSARSGAAVAAPLPTLVPLPPLDFAAGTALQNPQFQNPQLNIPQQSQSIFLQPVFRTGGS